jgi:hypothetical protein
MSEAQFRRTEAERHWLRPSLPQSGSVPAAVYAAIPDGVSTIGRFCQHRHRASKLPMTTAKVLTNNCGFPPFGTRSVQLSERRRGTLLPKRHQIKHF